MQLGSLLHQQEAIRRRGSAILAADVVDYSRLMAEDEVGTHDRVKACLVDFVEPTILEHRGRIVRLIGDGVLVEFAEVAPALACAVAIQRGMAARDAQITRGRRILFRIGVNHGDVIVDGDGIYGNGVNVAVRLEALADPGGVFISGAARERVGDDASYRYAALGERLLKNIAEPVAVYRVVFDPHGEAAPGDLPIPPSIAVPAASALPRCPYRGLFAFREEDASYFFGRQNTIDELEAAVDDRSLVAVLGASGSGKSSVVFAGLVPRLRASGGWLVAAFRPDRTPLRSLLAALLPLRDRAEEETLRDELEVWHARLSAGRATLGELVDQILLANSSARRLLLIADQFEQIYTLVEDPDERERLLAPLLELLQQTQSTGNTPRVTLILTLRADFLGRVLTSRRLADALKGADVKLGPLTEDELRAAIENPARQQGVRFEMGLVDRILMDVRGQAGRLPLLEFALTELWACQRHGRLTHVGYEEIGGVAEAIAAYAEEVYRRLAPPEQERVRQVFLQLVRPGEGTEDTGRVASRADIQDERWGAVDRLADARLVVTRRDEGSGQDTAEVVHEALIREWQRLRRWVDGDREFLVWRQRLAEARKEWQAGGRAEGYLLRAAPLALALDWLGKRGAELGGEDRAFVEASHARLQREQAAERRRRRVALFGLASVAALFFALFVGAGGLWYEASEQKRAAQVAESLYQTDRSSEQLRAGDPKAAIRLALEALPGDLSDPARPYVAEAEAQLYRALAADRSSTAMPGQGSSVWHAAASPAGDLIATGSEDGKVRLWRVSADYQPSLDEVLEGHTGPVTRVAFSPDGALLLSASHDGTARLWNLAQERSVVLAGHAGPVVSAAFSPDGRRMATASWDHTARLWQVPSGAPLGAPLDGHRAALTQVAFDPTGARLVTTSLDGTAILRDAATGRPLLPPLEGQEGPVWLAAFSPDGARLLTASEGVSVPGDNPGVEPLKRINTLWIWDVATGERLVSLEGHRAGVLDAAFSPPSRTDPAGGRLLATGSRDGSARLWDSRTNRQLALLEAHAGPVTRVAFSPDGRRLVTASRDGSARVWDTASGREVGLPQRHQGAVLDAEYLSDGRHILTAAEDGTTALAEVEPGRQVALLDRHTGPVGFVAFAPAGADRAGRHLVLTTSRDHTVWGEQMKGDATARLWDADSGRQLAVLEGHQASVRFADFSRDGRRILTGSEDGTAMVWSLADDLTVQRELTLRGHQAAILHVALAPDGQSALTASADGTARLWDLTTGAHQLLVPPGLERHPKPVYLARFSHTGASIVTGAADGSSWLWRRQADGDVTLVTQLDDADTAVIAIDFSPDDRLIVTALETPAATVSLWDGDGGSLLGHFEGHRGPVMDAVFSPDGRWLATGSEDETARLWEVATRRSLAVMKGHVAGLPTVAFAPFGERPRIVTGSWDGTVRLWDGLSGEQLAEFLGHKLGTPKVVFSPDGTLIASASWDGTARVWQVMGEGQSLIDDAQRLMAGDARPQAPE